MKKEAERGTPIKLHSVQEKVAKATKVSLRSFGRIKAELDNIKSGMADTFVTPHKERPRRVRKSSMDGFNENVIRPTVHDFYKTEKQRPTLKKILAKVKTCINFDGSVFTLRKVLKKLGFTWGNKL
ncbi:hypothetical protein ANN_24509 [Periplaneta americana]|uniref:Winged helix-turn helix domain-containing protein n=1 Tax=Periplaneta americana TaxID=6978 RepID=A0ABQ8S3A2_PERAM|nr:hypothetical protein ANN_24509 [Periplaneta americana]